MTVDRRTAAVGVTTVWAGWWTRVALHFGLIGGREREEILLAVGILLILWAQPLLALRGTRAAGVALLINAAVLGIFVAIVGGPGAVAWLFVHFLLPPAAAGALLLSRGSYRRKTG